MHRHQQVCSTSVASALHFSIIFMPALRVANSFSVSKIQTAPDTMKNMSKIFTIQWHGWELNGTKAAKKAANTALMFSQKDLSFTKNTHRSS